MHEGAEGPSALTLHAYPVASRSRGTGEGVAARGRRLPVAEVEAECDELPWKSSRQVAAVRRGQPERDHCLGLADHIDDAHGPKA